MVNWAAVGNESVVSLPDSSGTFEPKTEAEARAEADGEGKAAAVAEAKAEAEADDDSEAGTVPQVILSGMALSDLPSTSRGESIVSSGSDGCLAEYVNNLPTVHS